MSGRFKSYAQWPKEIKGLNNVENITEDDHDTMEAANAVCNRLAMEGFGGRYQVFPIRVWTEDTEKTKGE